MISSGIDISPSPKIEDNQRLKNTKKIEKEEEEIMETSLGMI